ncbi:hypothetical protein [Modicisalibacter coralii]|uniref:hypothetical protein n=1 Tax=Modicisalibacter coralii TaxID=2304602 RepID=UPI00100B8D03|nr:hypothetical protein [Halomonas coralii]
MADRDHEPRLNPIVPGPEDELTQHHRAGAASRGGRTGPLWLVCLLLLAGLCVLSGWYWVDRQSWHETQRELAGQISNMHARLDGLDDGRGVSASTFEERIGQLSDEQQALDHRISELAGSVESLDQQAADNSALAALEQRLDAARQQRDSLTATLSATQRSMNALEQKSDEGRQALATRLDTLEASRDELRERIASFEDASQTLTTRVEAMGKTLDDLDSRLGDLAGRVAALSDGADSRQAQWQTLDSSVSELRAAITELRQNQVAINATLESLGNR